MPKSYLTTSGPKQKCRELICKEAKKHGIKPKRILTLPAEEMLCVKTFQRHFPKANITGLERDNHIFNLISSKAPLGLTIENMSIDDFTKKSNPGQHFDIAFLDYLGPITHQTRQEVINLVSNKNIIHQGKSSIIAITFMKANRQGVDYTEELIRKVVGYGRKPDNNASNVKLVIQNALAGFEPKVIAAEEYVNNGGVPMYFFLLKIVG